MSQTAQKFLKTVVGPPDRSRDPFPRAKVIGEVKPHTTSGIAGGINQLRRRFKALPAPARTATRPQLITYRAAARDGYYEVLAPDSLHLKTWILTGSRPAGLRWYSLGEFYFAPALETIQKRQCPSLLGSEIERRVRSHYAARIGISPLDLRSAAKHGADIQHEFAQFLRELAAELEAGY